MGKDFKKLSRASRHNLQILGKITVEKDGASEEESYTCNTINISLSGALVETGSVIPLGSLLKYSFCMPGFTIPVNLIGEVVRGERDSSAELPQKLKPAAGEYEEVEHRKINRYGIIFLDMNEKDKKAMENYFLKFDKRPE